jgi:hypothetical protein
MLRLSTTCVCTLALLFGCATYTLPTAPQTQHDIPELMYGLGPGPTSMDTLRRGGWVLADTKENTQIFVLATPAPGVNDVEAQVVLGKDGSPFVQFLRQRYQQTRSAAYDEVVHTMVSSYGQPQASSEVVHFALFEQDAVTAETPRPPGFIVHRWEGRRADLLLVAGVDDPGVLASYMQYQLLLVPHGAAQPSKSETTGARYFTR